MFYQFDDDVTSVDYSDLKDNTPVLGYISRNELEKIQKHFELPLQAVEMCREQISPLASNLDIYNNCYFIRLAIPYEKDSVNSAGIFILKNTFLIVNISDKEFFNRDLFIKTTSKLCVENAGIERIITSFFESLVLIDDSRLDMIRSSIAQLEEDVINNKVDNSFNVKLLEIKRNILSLRGYYERLIDISQILIENENEIFDESIKRLGIFIDKVNRLKDNVDLLTDSVVHLWDAYQASLNMRLNETMKFFTLVTTIFFPLTVIVGWYGMNFSTMPEFSWKYGYPFVIVFSILIISALILWFKKKKWI